MWIFYYIGASLLNPCIVQVSTIHMKEMMHAHVICKSHTISSCD